MAKISQQTKIIQGLVKFAAAYQNPDATHNQGKLLGEMFFWDEVASYAKKQSEVAWETAEKEGVTPTEERASGDYIIAASPSFTCTLSVSVPVRRFSGDALVEALAASKFKIPRAVAKLFVDNAKVPTKGIKKYNIIET